MWRPSKEWFNWAKQLPVDDSPIGRQITRDEALELFKRAKTLNYNDEIKIANYGKPDFNFSEKDLATLDEMQNAVEACEKSMLK